MTWDSQGAYWLHNPEKIPGAWDSTKRQCIQFGSKGDAGPQPHSNNQSGASLLDNGQGKT